MFKVFPLLTILLVSGAYAGTIDYNTTGSTLSCNSVSGCVQNTSTSVTIGGLTFTYFAGSGSGVNTPSIINLGALVSTGTGSGVDVTGLALTINVNSTPGGSGSLPNGAFSGSISTSNSGATLHFSSNNTTTGFGTLPGVTISGPSGAFTYQILNTTLGIPAPALGNPLGQLSILGAVTDVTPTGAPEPGAFVLMTAGIGLLGLKRIRRSRGTRQDLA